MNGDQCRMARAALKLGVKELAAVAKVSTQTVTRLEAGENLKPRTIEDIERVLAESGVIFLDTGATTDGGPGVRLKG